MTKKIAFIISRILGPVPLICLLWLVTALKSGIGFWKAIWVYSLIFLICIAIPITLTTFLIVQKKISDIEWSKISDRRKFGLPILLIDLILLLMLTYFLTNQTIFHLTLVFSFIALANSLIYLFSSFKISAHMAGATIVFAGVNLFYHLRFMWLFLLLIPIAWARYTLKIHTLLELITGATLTFGILLLALLLFGYPAVP